MDLHSRLNDFLVEHKIILSSNEIDLDEAKIIGTPVYSSQGVLAAYYIPDGFYNYSAYCKVSRGKFGNAFRVASVLTLLNLDKPISILFEYMDLVCKVYFDTDNLMVDRSIVLKNIEKVKNNLYQVNPVLKKYFWVKPYTNIGVFEKEIDGVVYDGKRKIVLSQLNKSRRIETISKIENAIDFLISEDEDNRFITIADISEISGVPNKTISNIYSLFKSEVDNYNISVFNTSVYTEFIKMNNVSTISSSIKKFKEELETRLTKKKVANSSKLHINTVYNLWCEDEVQDALLEYNKWLIKYKKQ